MARLREDESNYRLESVRRRVGGLRTSKSAILFPCLPPLAVLVDDIQNFALGKGYLIRVIR